MEQAERKHFRSISTKVILYMLIFTFLSILASTIFHILDDYHSYTEEIKKRLDHVEKSYAKSISAILWDVDRGKLHLQLNGILELPGIEKIEIIGKNVEDNLILGKLTSSKIIEKRIALVHVVPPGLEGTHLSSPASNAPDKSSDSHFLGTLIISAGPQSILNQILQKGFRIFLIQTAQSIIFYVLILLLFDFFVTRHLRKIANILADQNFNGQNLRTIHLDREERYSDEFSLLINSYNLLLRRLNQYTKNLNALINEKTKDVSDLLNNIELGIFTILPNNKIHPAYSRSLEKILNTDNLARKDVMDILFTKSNLPSETLSDVMHFFVECLGEHYNIFEKKKSLLPNEIQLSDEKSPPQYLELSWKGQKTMDPSGWLFNGR
jgi:hypothetical protein